MDYRFQKVCRAADLKTATRTVVRHTQLSLTGCTSAEPASVSPANSIVMIPSIIVKSLFITKLPFSLCGLSLLRSPGLNCRK